MTNADGVALRRVCGTVRSDPVVVNAVAAVAGGAGITVDAAGTDEPWPWISSPSTAAGGGSPGMAARRQSFTFRREARADLGLIDEYEFLVQPVLAGRGPSAVSRTG